LKLLKFFFIDDISLDKPLQQLHTFQEIRF